MDSSPPALDGASVFMEEIEQDCAFTLWAFGVVFGEHHVHQTPGTPHQHHRRRLRAQVVPAVFPAVLLRRETRARRRRRRRSLRRFSTRVRPARRRQVQLQVQLGATTTTIPATHLDVSLLHQPNTCKEYKET